jgi:hypothetical protein
MSQLALELGLAEPEPVAAPATEEASLDGSEAVEATEETVPPTAEDAPATVPAALLAVELTVEPLPVTLDTAPETACVTLPTTEVCEALDDGLAEGVAEAVVDDADAVWWKRCSGSRMSSRPPELELALGEGLADGAAEGDDEALGVLPEPLPVVAGAVLAEPPLPLVVPLFAALPDAPWVADAEGEAEELGVADAEWLAVLVLPVPLVVGPQVAPPLVVPVVSGVVVAVVLSAASATRAETPPISSAVGTAVSASARPTGTWIRRRTGVRRAA